MEVVGTTEVAGIIIIIMAGPMEAVGKMAGSDKWESNCTHTANFYFLIF